MEFYLSDILTKPVYNQSKEKIGILVDLLTSDINKAHPKISGLVVDRPGRKRKPVFIPTHDIDLISPKTIKLTTDVVDLSPVNTNQSEILLTRDVYDKQIVDIDDRRLTRVNDLLLEFEHDLLRLKGVDVSVVGIIKRLKLPHFELIFHPNIVDWEDVQFLAGPQPMKFNIQYKNLESMHPVDIARIIFEGPGYKQGSKVLASLTDPIAADIIEGLPPKLQKNLVESMQTADIADVVDHMPAHKAADLLVVLGSSYADQILPLLDKNHAKEIESLLNYPEYTAGAYMTTDFLTASASGTVDEVYEHIRDQKDLPDHPWYVYLLENARSNKLMGVMSVADLIVADRRDRVDKLMVQNFVKVNPMDSIKDTLKKMYRYNISAVPVVVKGEGKILGIVTFKDAVTKYLPKRWKIRMRRILTG